MTKDKLTAERLERACKALARAHEPLCTHGEEHFS